MIPPSLSSRQSADHQLNIGTVITDEQFQELSWTEVLREHRVVVLGRTVSLLDDTCRREMISSVSQDEFLVDHQDDQAEVICEVVQHECHGGTS